MGAFSPLPMSPCLSPLLPPYLWDQAGQLLPSAAVKAKKKTYFMPEGELGPTPSSLWRGAHGAAHRLSAPASVPEPILHRGTTVMAAVSWLCCAGVGRPRGCLSLISDCVIRECLIFLLALR